MIQLTLKDARPELSRIAGVTGFRVTDDRFLDRLNRAIEELMHEGDWPGVVDRYRFAVFGGLITLPGDLERILGIALDGGSPLAMSSPWYEFVQNGPGPQEERGWLDTVLDRGECCTFQGIPDDGTAYTLRVYGRVDERVNGERPKILLRGFDGNGGWIRTQMGEDWIDGVEVEINGDTAPFFIIPPMGFRMVEAVLKPQTRGTVDIKATNGAAVYHLASYAPIETHPSYRRYFVPFLDPAITHNVLIRARKRFVPVRDDNDFLLISHMGALGAMLKALQKSDADDIGGYFNFKKIAVGLLNKEARSYFGEAVNPVMTFAPGFGMGGIPHIQ